MIAPPLCRQRGTTEQLNAHLSMQHRRMVRWYAIEANWNGTEKHHGGRKDVA
jgi:hypothetical protein